MISEYIGIVINRLNNQLIMVINPTCDEELDNTCWTTSSDEDRLLLKVSRKESPLFSEMSLSSVSYIQQNLEHFIVRIK